MDLVVDTLYYRILDRNVHLSQRAYQIICATMEDFRALLITYGFNGAFPVMEDPVEYEYLNTPLDSPDSGHCEKEPEKPAGR